MFRLLNQIGSKASLFFMSEVKMHEYRDASVKALV